MGNLGDPKAGNGGHFWSFWLNLYRASEGTGDNWDHNESFGVNQDMWAQYYSDLSMNRLKK